MQTIAVINQKGGCGKTTTAISLSGFFAARGLRTLLVDMDPQSHCAAGLAIPEGRIDLSIGDAMLAAETDVTEIPPVDPDRLLWRVSRNLDLAPSNLRLAGLEALRGGLATEADPERRLARVLGSLANRYDLAVIDCSPAIGLLAYNALVAAEQILIPVETGFFSLQGAGKQINTIKSLTKRLGVAPTHRLLPTLHHPDSVLARDLLDELHRRFPDRVIPIAVRYDAALKEAASFGQPVGEYAPDSAGASDYRSVADWLLEHTLRRPSIKAALQTMQPERPIVIEATKPPATAAPMSESAVPAPSPLSTPTPEPVRLSPGVGDRTLDGARAAAPVTAHAPVPAAGGNAAAPLPASRALEMIERTRRLHERPPAMDDVPSLVPEAPATPPTSAFAPAAPLHTAPRDLEDGVLTPRPHRALGLHLTPRGVLFVQPASLGEQIQIAGDFNNWMPHRSPMTLNRMMGVFELLVPLPAGVAQYRLVVDGRWMADPFNPAISRNPYGETNSVVNVPEQLSA